MNLRLIEFIAKKETVKEAREAIDEEVILGAWIDETGSDYSQLRVLLGMDYTEKVSDMLSDRFSDAEGFRIMLFNVEATVPKEEEEEATEEKEGKSSRISREELYADVTNESELDSNYLSMVFLSTLVAGTGLLLNDVATIIGAMVIAPLLAPNVSLALAATLADMELGWKSLRANMAGLLLSLALSVILGMIFTVNASSEQILSRTMVSLKHIMIALAAGSAGVLAFTRGVPAAIVGVMVAVALLPPLVVVGLLMGAGYWQLAVGSGILTLTNLICINLAGVITFLLQGIRPRHWADEKKAKKSSTVAIAIWFIMLIGLAIAIWYWGGLNVEDMMPT